MHSDHVLQGRKTVHHQLGEVAHACRQILSLRVGAHKEKTAHILDAHVVKSELCLVKRLVHLRCNPAAARKEGGGMGRGSMSVRRSELSCGL